MLFVLYSNKFFTVFNGSCTRPAARDRNNAKHFLVAFSQSWNRFCFKLFKEPYIYDVHTEGSLVMLQRCRLKTNVVAEITHTDYINL